MLVSFLVRCMKMFDLIHPAISIPSHVPFLPGAELDLVHDTMTDGCTGDRLQKKVLRMLSCDNLDDDAEVARAAVRTVQLAATFELLCRKQNAQNLFEVESEAVTVKRDADKCVQLPRSAADESFVHSWHALWIFFTPYSTLHTHLSIPYHHVLTRCFQE